MQITFSKDLKTPEAIAEAIEAAASQLNACSVALANLAIGGDALDKDGKSPRWLLLSAFCDANTAAGQLVPGEQAA